MREAPAQTVYRQDYAPPAYWIRSVDLAFDLDAAKTLVTSRLRIERNPAVADEPLRLHGEELNLLRVQVDGQSVSFRNEDNLLVLDAPAAHEFTLEIRNTIAPDKNTQLSGLYASSGGLYTQCEAEGFRRITYFLDRPDVMAVYTVTLRAERARYPVLLCNGNLVEEKELDGGRHSATWHDPYPKPSYLFALVAGDLSAREQQVRTRSGRNHLLQVYVKRSDLDRTEHAMNSLVASVVWDEARFALPLDLERFMIVAVEDFNGGAMENKGLNLFNTKYVLANAATATDADFLGVESVIAHEYFHNWTGNRITCRDWFQLSLKEGLTVFRDQEFSMDMAGDASARAVKRIADVRQLRQYQFPEDAGPMAHPVRPDSYVAIDNFYTSTVYEKGAEVVRMMHTLVGRDGFVRGMALYFQRHDGQAVTCDDFAQAIADANPGSALHNHLDGFKRWYAQSGTPRLMARGHYDADAQRYTLDLEQRATPQPGGIPAQPFVLPIAMGLLARDGRALPLQADGGGTTLETVLVMTEARQQFVFNGIASAPVPSLLRGFSAPVQLDDGLPDADLLVLLAHDSDAFNRWEAGQRLALNHLRSALNGNGDAVLDDAFVDGMRRALRDPALDPAFKELVLTPPSETYIAEQMDRVDAQRIHAVRESMLQQLATRLLPEWVWAWDTHQVHAGYQPDAVQRGRRALANLALGMLVRHAVRTGDAVWPGRAYQRFKDATNMTDRLGSLSALVYAQADLSDAALERFYELFRGDALVIDKWFALQAHAPESNGRVLARVRALLQHPDFSLTNPNRVRSLVFVYCNANPASFHRPDGAGYALWADMVLALDAANPKVSARLARSMDRWATLAEPSRSAALAAITRVAAHGELSEQTREIISRALESV